MSRHTHLMAVGGIGMSALAELLLRRGERVSGCDRHLSHITDRLAARGAEIHEGHDPSHLAGVDRLVFSDAIHADNPELFAAQRQGMDVLRRTELLAELMADYQGVAVAGTHGKTSVTAMIGLVLVEAGRDPLVLVGGEVAEFGGNYRAGAGPELVTEACEAYGGFLDLHPRFAIITNVEADHLDHYRDLADIRAAFRQFAGQVRADGVLALCADDPGLLVTAGNTPARVVTYGFAAAADYRAAAVCDGDPTVVEVMGPAGPLGQLELSVPGRHVAQNALGAVALCMEMGVPFGPAAAALARFHGVARRFQVLGRHRGVTVLDDYAHHPTEIKATLAAVRPRCRGRLVAVFQPHLFSRTQQLLEEFAGAFDAADEVIFTDIYPAREEPIAGVSAELLAERAAARRGDGGKGISYIGPKEAICPRLLPGLAAGDWVVTLGAGDVDHVARCLVAALQEQREP